MEAKRGPWGRLAHRGWVTFAVAGGAALVVTLPVAATADINDTVCDLRDALSILLTPCQDEAPPVQTDGGSQTEGKTPPTRARVPNITAPINQATTGRSTRTGPISPQLSPSAQTSSKPVAVVAPPAAAPASDALPGRSAPDPQKEGLAAAVMTLVSGVVLWLVFLRPRRKRDAMQATEQLQRDIVANLTHELMTPMTPLVGYAQLIASGRLKGSEIKRIARQMMKASQQLERRIDLLVTYATLRRAGFAPGADVVNVPKLVGTIAEEHGDGRTTVGIDGSMRPVRADERLLRLAIQELVDNALKFSPAGESVHVTVSRSSASDGEARLEISVADRGIGLDDDSLNASFEAFHQMDPSSTRDYGGFGLGLTLADEIARVHGGVIRATSEPAVGSVFTLSIPERPVLSSVIAVTHAA